MKKIIALVICLLITTSVFAFDKGTKLVWGQVDFSSIKNDKDSDPYSLFELNSIVSYFLMEDIALNVILSWYNYHYKGDSYTLNLSDIYIGLGGAYFIKNFYLAASFMYELMGDKETYKSDDTWNANAMYLDFAGGYLFPLIENVFINIGADYMVGIGEYGGDDGEGDNTSSEFSVGAGLVVAIP